MARKEHIEKRLVGDDRGIVDHFDCFNMSGHASRNLLIRRIGTFASHIARLDFNDATQARHHSLNAPKTPTTKIRDLCLRLFDHLRHKSHRQRVHTVTCILVCHLFANKDMP